LTQGAAIVRDRAEARAPRRTEQLATTMVVEPVEKGHESATVAVGPHKDAFYGLFQELGTSTMPAKPFLRPALDESEGEVVETVRQELARQARRGR